MVKRLIAGRQMARAIPLINQKKDIVSDRLFKCTKCNFVWSQVYELGRKKVIDKYENFPSYGLKRKTCKECVYASKELNK
jgi:hypothetical protein